MKIIQTLILTIGLVACSTGCAAGQAAKQFFVGKGPVDVLRPAQTNIVDIPMTNSVYVAASTNAAGEITPASIQITVQHVLTPVVTPAILFTNTAIGNGISTTIQDTSSLASAAGVPWAQTAGAGLLGLGGLVTGVVNWFRRRKALAQIGVHENTIVSLKNTAATLVQNVEAVRKAALQIPAYAAIDNKVMHAVQTAQALAGPEVKSTINNLVDQHTDFTTAAPIPAAAP